MNTYELIKIEQQGADFVRAMIPFLHTTLYADKVWHLWRMVMAHRGHQESPRKSPIEWRSYRNGHIEEYAFAAGAEQAIRDYEATL